MKSKISFLSILFFLVLNSNLYALTKDSILKVTSITNEKNLYCLYSVNESKLASVDANKNYVYQNIDKKITAVKKTANQFKKKYNKAKTKKLKNKYYKSYQKAQKTLNSLKTCKSYKPLEIACEIFEGNNLKSANNKILNGVKCQSPEKSQVVKIVIDYGVPNVNNGLCTGTLITQNAVLTAAHCFESIAPKNVKVYFGNKTYYNVKNWIVNPIYDTFADEDHENGDTAILFLEKNVKKTPFKLVSKNYAPKVGDLAVMIGNGIIEYKYKGGLLYSVKNGLYGGFSSISGVTKTGIRIFYDKSLDVSNTCKGDSGGPLAIYQDGAWRLLGVASWGSDEKCGFFTGKENSWWSKINSKDNIEFLEKYLPGIYN